MTVAQLRVRGALVAVAACGLLAAGCFRKPKHPEPTPAPVVLEVHNRGFFDVEIYNLMPGGTTGLRLMGVTGFSTGQVAIRYMELQPGGILAVRVHAIGVPFSWTSPSLSLSPGDHAELDIYSDANGNMNRSTLYPLPGTGGAR
ncbi:MAG: hypothetical protein KGO23_15050 [Nitrospirota bacterium]|nr:hypothetical protein [Nitrospirota bacterium]